MISQIGIERAVLSGYLQIDLTPDAFKENAREKLDPSIFVMPFHRRIAKKINEAIENNQPLPLLFSLIEEKSEGTRYELDMLYLGATLPLSNDTGLDDYIKVLIQHKIERELGL